MKTETENNRLKLIRENLRKTQAEFAVAFGLKQGSYADVERGKVKISGNIKRILEKEFNVNLHWLEFGEEDMFANLPSNENTQIPMYNFPVAAGGVETYIDPNDVKVVGHLNIPGAHKDSVAIPAYGDSMYPTLSNGDWAVSRPIGDPTEIVWGELYYVEWSDYKMYKRLLHADNEDEVVLWSDNQQELIGDRPKFAAMTIKKEKIRKLRLVTEILKKPNY